MQIPIISGIFSDNGPDIRTSYPVNLVPTPKESGISSGFLRPGHGIVANGVGPGTDRGGINWNGTCYRVMGTNLVTVDAYGNVSVLGYVGGSADNLVSMTYSFDRLAIASDNKLYYWDGSLTQVVDPDIGAVLDVVWVDGYFMTTDGANLVVTELSDPTQVNPLKYGSSEIDPDPVLALLKLRNEIYALNRYTIEVFDNIGGELFPFQRIEGAQITKGVLGSKACCVFVEAIAFLGSGRNEAPGIYLGANASSQKISTQEIDDILLSYSESDLSKVNLEARTDKNHRYLYVNLSDRTLVYDAAGSSQLNQPVWFVLTSSLSGFSRYLARHYVWAYDKWLVADPLSSSVGYLDDTISTHWGNNVRWEFGTQIIYNEGNSVIFNEIELVALPGRVATGYNAKISTSYSIDGISWSQDRSIGVGTTGDTRKRLVWFQQGYMRNWRIQRFRGDTQAHLSFVRLEAQLEPLVY